MDFYAVLDQVVDLLRRRERVSYRALRRQFQLDEEALEDLKTEIIKAQRLAVDEDGEVLVWTGEPGTASPVAPAPARASLAEALGMRPLVAHCHLGLGRLYHQTGRGEQARAALTAAIGLYHAMDMTFWLPQAEAALAQVEGR